MPPPPQHDFFTVQSNPTLGADGQPTGGFAAQLDLAELGSALAPRLRDPDSDFTVSEVVPRADPANQTPGPHRYTIFVPHDEGAMINVGAGRSPFSDGIGMATKSTIALRTFDGVPTSLNLGLAWEFWGIKVGGYSLITEGHSNHTAKYQVTLCSQEDGASITAAKEVSLTSQNASVTLAAAEMVSVTGKKLALHSITAPPLEASGWDTFCAIALVGVDAASTVAPLAGVKGDNPALASTTGAVNFLGGVVSANAEALKAKWMAAASSHGTKALTHVAALATLYLSYKKSFKSPTPGKTAWQVRASKFKTLLAAAKELKSIYSDYLKTASPSSPGISIESDSTIGVSAKGKITVNGDGGVAVTGGFGGASLAGLSVSVAGQKDAAISGGLGVTVKSLAGDVELSSDLKGAAVKGKKAVVMSSEADTASVTGNLDVQLNSVTAKAFVHGKAGATVAAGPGAGFGLVVKPENLTLGKVANADKFGSTAADGAFAVIRMTDGALQLKVTSDSEVAMTKSQVKFKTPKVDMSASGKVIIKGSTVEIC